jgi:hypothetical protein
VTLTTVILTPVAHFTDLLKTGYYYLKLQIKSKKVAYYCFSVRTIAIVKDGGVLS